MPHRLIPRRVRERMGRRGVLLALFGLVWLVMGVTHLAIPELANRPDAAFWHERLHPYMLAAMWGGSGLLSIMYGFSHRRRNDTIGFLAVCAMPMTLSVSYFIGGLTRLLLGDPVWLLGVLGFLVYGILAFALAVIASWPDVEGGEGD